MENTRRSKKNIKDKDSESFLFPELGLKCFGNENSDDKITTKEYIIDEDDGEGNLKMFRVKRTSQILKNCETLPNDDINIDLRIKALKIDKEINRIPLEFDDKSLESTVKKAMIITRIDTLSNLINQTENKTKRTELEKELNRMKVFNKKFEKTSQKQQDSTIFQ